MKLDQMFITTLLLCACAPEPWASTGTFQTERFESAAVGDEYVLRLRLPPDYDPGGAVRYPLVVQLDPTFVGSEQMAITTGLVSQYAADGDWPEAIVLGVDYPDPRTRERDYVVPETPDPQYETTGPDRFYAALRDEILPHIEAEHAVDAEQRVLVGHSNGGVFAWYAAFRHEDGEAPLFAGIVAGDNLYSEQLFTLERWHAERASDLPLRIFASRAVYNGATQQLGLDWMTDRLESRGFPNLKLETAVFETDHGGALWPSYEQGLAHVLAGAR